MNLFRVLVSLISKVDLLRQKICGETQLHLGIGQKSRIETEECYSEICFKLVKEQQSTIIGHSKLSHSSPTLGLLGSSSKQFHGLEGSSSAVLQARLLARCE